MKKSKKFLSFLCATCMILATAAPAFAAESVDNLLISPRGAYIRELVGYDSTTNKMDMKYQSVGSASLTNNGTTTSTLYFYYQTSGTVTGSLGASITTAAQANVVLGSVSQSIGYTATLSKSWTAGTNTGASVLVLPGKTAFINGYIAGVTTSGSLKYKVYMIGYESNWWYEYSSLSNQKVPTDHIHLETSGNRLNEISVIN